MVWSEEFCVEIETALQQHESGVINISLRHLVSPASNLSNAGVGEKLRSPLSFEAV